MTEERIVRGCAEGEPIYQRYLYDRYQAKMLGVCMRYARDKEDAQDVLQDGFIKVFENISEFKGMGSLEGWIRKIMVNMALQHLRKNKKREKDQSIDLLEEQISSGDYILETMHADEIMGFIQRLPQGYRTVFNLYAVEGFSHQEIATKLGISVNTSFSQFSRAKSLLQKLLEKHKVNE